MRLLTLLSPALLAATAISSSASSSSSSPSSSATPEPTPVGQLWTAQWKDSDLSPYTKLCASTSKITAKIFKLGEMYPDLKTWAPELKVFYNKQLYPGSWNGEDKHGNDRELMKMEYEELPFAVREWIARNPKQRHFSVQDEVVFFAPGAMYPILPLWVEEPEGKGLDCEGVFDDLENYSNEPKDGVVIARLEHKKTGEKEVEVTIEAMQVKKAAEQKRDEL
ncbi:uncharacterized protein BDR25DRAFT_238955 [Lindgomyces ingoldianus]|uniref:Uncharacterized protein n=1 Tax=Lindgomyces ingoldianus TaxID=673940 RepID=A0ACB6QFD7_9PLEO|nr:uncharacterized protein BDR25DRAFT_238955 [Lindgomyces ingoldianus]KAF2465703.1 hypothetical protein BDR25DRAFT_238955 [Lindgomyces ingoldianus]